MIGRHINGTKSLESLLYDRVRDRIKTLRYLGLAGHRIEHNVERRLVYLLWRAIEI